LNSSASKFIPFYRRIKGRQAKNYILGRKKDHDEHSNRLVVKLGDEGFLTRAEEGREGTVMVMWKRRFLFNPQKPAKEAAAVSQY
jgi:alpha-glucuronidase